MTMAHAQPAVTSDDGNQRRTRLVRLAPHIVDHVTRFEREFLDCVSAALSPCHVSLRLMDRDIAVEGDDPGFVVAVQVMEQFAKAMPGGGSINLGQVREILKASVDFALNHDLVFVLPGLTYPVRPMSLAQVAYMNALLSPRDLVLGVGPTGTGKTHLAIAAAISLLDQGSIKHIVITRPHVRLEEEVVSPSVRSETQYDEQFTYIEDVFRDLVGQARLEQMVALHQLEVVPLGRLRERTFNNSLIIIDEAQNMTARKLRMALTRAGRHSRVVVTGDPAQIHLFEEGTSGLPHLLKLLEATDMASIHRFDTGEIVRSDLARRLEELYAGSPDGN